VKRTDRVEILSAWESSTIEWKGTWISFLDANADGFEDAPEEVLAIAKTLDRGDMWTFGGGAAEVLMLRKTSG
jgi:hypothetical protein